MFKTYRVERKIGDSVLSIETGMIARQADGAVMVRCGDTMVMVTATTAPPRFEDIDFFPLSVDYRERYSAAGRFPGGFIKREGRPSTKEILTARMIDRPIRPLFPDGYFEEVQVLCTVLSADPEYDPDVLAMVGASAALTISKIPFQGPLGAVRVSRVDGQFMVNPTYEQRSRSDYNVIVAGRREGINMIEVDAKEMPEDVVVEGLEAGQNAVLELIGMLDELRQQCGVEKEIPDIEQDDGTLEAEFVEKYGATIRESVVNPAKAERRAVLKELRDQAIEHYCTVPEGSPEGTEPRCSLGLLKRVWEKVEKKTIRSMILNEGTRPDGRGYTDIRPIDCKVALLPRTHGSALFTRGETQALISVTLGTVRDEQTVDGLVQEYGQSFMLHYNFPPSSVGEVRPIRGPGRREIGHGALAEKALEQVRPNEEGFPYTIKIVSDITESNGSSSMASVCGGCLALMDAGVPIQRPVAGISVGMVSDGDRWVLLTDILGDEDHAGDMDFKVAGTEQGVTAIQLDLKRDYLTFDMIRQTFDAAKAGRLHILGLMKAAIAEPRSEVSVYAPKIISIKIDPEYIGKVIGPGGAMIKGIQEQTGTLIEIEEDGTVSISCVGGTGHLQAKSIIESMTTPPQVGRIYEAAKVVSVKEFGAFVEISPGVEGLCHISELDEGYVKSVDQVCKVGDVIPVKLLLIDEQGRFKLSRKAALKEMGQGGEGGEASQSQDKPQKSGQDPSEKRPSRSGGGRGRR